MDSIGHKRHFAATTCLLFFSIAAAKTVAAQNFEWTVALGEPQLAFSPSSFDHVQDGVSADVNGDGRADLLFLGGKTPDLAPYVSLNVDTAGTFVGGPLQQIGSTAPYTRLQVADVTGDGRLDIIVAGRDIPVRIFVNSGNQQPFSVSAVQIVGEANRWARGLAIADANGDGFVDIAVANTAGGPLPGNDIYLSNGSPTPFAGATRHSIGADNVFGYQVAFADVNGDDRQDAVLASVDVVNGFSGQAAGVRIYLNSGGSDPFGAVAPALIPTGTIDSGLAIADLNADQRPDLIVTSGDGLVAVWSIYMHSGSLTQPYGAATQLPHTPYVSTLCHSVFATDLNGDNHIDIGIGCMGGGTRPYRPVRISGALYLNAGGADPFANAEPIEIPLSGVQSGEPMSSVTALATVPLNGSAALLATSGQFLAQPKIELYPFINDRRPIANSDVASTSQGQSVNIDVVANDIDADGSMVRDSVEIRKQGTNGVCAFDRATAMFAYTPAPGFVGTDHCQYVAKDNLGVYSNAAIVSVSVVAIANTNAGGDGGGGGSYGVVSLLVMMLLLNARRLRTNP